MKLDVVTLETLSCAVVATDGCVVLQGEEDRIILTRGQAESFAAMVAPFSLVLSSAVRRAADVTLKMGSGEDRFEED